VIIGCLSRSGGRKLLGRSVGIDLGQTTALIALLEGGEPTVVPNAEGSRTTPSVVAFAKNEVLVGEAAERQAVTNVDRTIRSPRLHMGTDWAVTIDGNRFTPQQISAFILMKLKRDAEAYLGEKITDAVITVPAYFSAAQRQATEEAGQIAGLNVLGIINEPTSAALAYHLEMEDEATTLVFDLDKETLHVSLLIASQRTMERLAASEDNYLGGDDWYKRIVDWLVKDFKEGYGIDLSEVRGAPPRLAKAAKETKKELSQSSESWIEVLYILSQDSRYSLPNPPHVKAKLTMAEFQRMTSDLLDRCEGLLQEVIKDSGVKAGRVDHVVLVGGSTRMPAVMNLVKSLTGGKEPCNNIDPDEVVALGACRQAGLLTGEFRRRRERAEVRNHAGSLIDDTEKILGQNEDKVPEDIKSEVRESLAEVKKALENSDTETIRTATEQASKVAQKMGTAIDQQAKVQQGSAQAMLPGHAFISYVHENSADVDNLQGRLEAAGVRVWRDTADLWPGDNWRERIRHAIVNDAFVFLACFSNASVARRRSFQNEELALAIEQMRLHRLGDTWLIPVRFDDCTIPDTDIRSDLRLSSLHRADLFGDFKENALDRLVATAQRVLRGQV
jgi:molecular chaperone DnaK (HSP70)